MVDSEEPRRSSELPCLHMGSVKGVLCFLKELALLVADFCPSWPEGWPVAQTVTTGFSCFPSHLAREDLHLLHGRHSQSYSSAVECPASIFSDIVGVACISAPSVSSARSFPEMRKQSNIFCCIMCLLCRFVSMDCSGPLGTPTHTVAPHTYATNQHTNEADKAWAGAAKELDCTRMPCVMQPLEWHHGSEL